ncbi:uncharacterized protein TNCV_2704721 [Trichonephila clavipes]|nr:uncharacterized protein TNCV_2704721 [Trichonephila clavipes]
MLLTRTDWGSRTFELRRSYKGVQGTVKRRLSEHLLSRASNIRTNFFCQLHVLYMNMFSNNVGTRSKDSLKNGWNKLWPDLKDEKDFKDDHREEITDFVQSIPGFQECVEEYVET